MIFFKIGFGILAFALVFHLLTRKYLNPFKLTIFFGKKGCGKTTNIVRYALKYRKLGWNVYSNVVIRVPGVRIFNVEELGYMTPEENSVVLVDEAGIYYHKREFANFCRQVRDWYKLQRHYRCRVFMFSQAWDIDLSLRELTDDMYLLSNVARVFTWAKRIKRRIVLTEPEGDKESRIADRLSFDSLLFWPFGSRFLCYIPKYVKYYDSFSAPELPALPYVEIPENFVPEEVRDQLQALRSRLDQKSGTKTRR